MNIIIIKWKNYFAIGKLNKKYWKLVQTSTRENKVVRSPLRKLLNLQLMHLASRRSVCDTSPPRKSNDTTKPVYPHPSKPVIYEGMCSSRLVASCAHLPLQQSTSSFPQFGELNPITPEMLTTLEMFVEEKNVRTSMQRPNAFPKWQNLIPCPKQEQALVSQQMHWLNLLTQTRYIARIENRTTVRKCPTLFL